MRIGTRVVMIAMAAGLFAAASATPSAASETVEWEPWTQQEWTAPAGVYCDFPLRLEVISQDLERRTLRTHPDGSVAAEQYRGPLTNYFVNDDTGARTRHDASGEMFVTYSSDGRMTSMTTVGPVGSGFKGTDDQPRGYYIMDGFHVVTIDDAGVKHLTVDAGAETEVCTGLD